MFSLLLYPPQAYASENNGHEIKLDLYIEYADEQCILHWKEIKGSAGYLVLYSSEINGKYVPRGYTETNKFSLPKRYGYYRVTPLKANEVVYDTSEPIHHFTNSEQGIFLMANTRTLGLGSNLKVYYGNNREYPWYISQENTGVYSNINCGPATATMAIKWANKDFNNTVIGARNTFKSTGGWWFNEDIVNYLELHNIQNNYISIKDKEDVIEEINKGKIIILCIDTSYIQKNDNSKEKTGKHYSYNGGHFIIAKGYVLVEDKVYFEIYDPMGPLNKGKDRYYLAEDLMQAIANWWSYGIVVSKNEQKY